MDSWINQRDFRVVEVPKAVKVGGVNMGEYGQVLVVVASLPDGRAVLSKVAPCPFCGVQMEPLSEEPLEYPCWYHGKWLCSGDGHVVTNRIPLMSEPEIATTVQLCRRPEVIEVRDGTDRAEIEVDLSRLGVASGALPLSRVNEIALQVAIELGMIDVDPWYGPCIVMQ